MVMPIIPAESEIQGHLGILQNLRSSYIHEVLSKEKKKESVGAEAGKV